MIVKPLAEESLGARSMCTFIETSDLKVLVDPGVALCPRRFGLPPHPKEYYALIEGREKILKYAEEADVIAITHYHFDHYTPSFVEWCCLWSSPEIARKIYEGKLVLAKDFKVKLSFNQRRRAWLFLQTCGKYAKKIINADGESFNFGDTEITFSKPYYHGPKGTMLGCVVMIYIKSRGESVLFASDVQGPMYKEPLDEILRLKPDTLILSGPPIYLLRFRLSEEDASRGLENLLTLAKNIPEIIVGHHLLRSDEWKKFLVKVSDVASQNGNRVFIVSEYLGVESRLLEFKRRELYEKYPPDEEFLSWVRMAHQKRRSVKPPL